jgi:hypothetical protein
MKQKLLFSFLCGDKETKQRKRPETYASTRSAGRQQRTAKESVLQPKRKRFRSPL